MNNQFKNITLEAQEGISFEVREKAGGLIIRAINLFSKTEYIGDYTKPPIPEGYSYVEGEWNNGFVIQDKLGNQFVWIPVGSLPANGTLDGENFTEKFGRRNYGNNEFSDSEYHEEMEDLLKKQFTSIQKYGGFYISRYTISKSKNRKPASVKDKMPWTDINFSDSVTEGKKIGQGKVQSHVWYGAEVDSIFEWLIATGKDRNEIISNSTNWGNYWNCENSPQKVVATGSREEWSANNICDLAGNVWEWTQEANGSSFRVLRCGSCYVDGSNYPACVRVCTYTFSCSNYFGFRVALYIE